MVWAMHTSSLVGPLTAYCYTTMVIAVLVAAAGAPVPIGALFIGLGVLSVQPHGPNFLALALLGTAAAVSGDVLDYGLGRAGRPVLYARLLRPFLKFSGIGIDDATKGLGRSSGMMIFLTVIAFPTLDKAHSRPGHLAFNGSTVSISADWLPAL